jgi:hypothetical protein
LVKVKYDEIVIYSIRRIIKDVIITYTASKNMPPQFFNFFLNDHASFLNSYNLYVCQSIVNTDLLAGSAIVGT